MAATSRAWKSMVQEILEIRDLVIDVPTITAMVSLDREYYVRIIRAIA